MQHAGSFPCPTALIRSKTVSAGRVASRGRALSAPPPSKYAPSQTLQQPAATLGATLGTYPYLAAACCNPRPLARPCSSLLQPLAPSHALPLPAATLGTQPDFAAACCNPSHLARLCSSLLQPLAPASPCSSLLQPLASPDLAAACCKSSRIARLCGSMHQPLASIQTLQQPVATLGT